MTVPWKPFYKPSEFLPKRNDPVLFVTTLPGEDQTVCLEGQFSDVFWYTIGNHAKRFVKPEKVECWSYLKPIWKPKK